MYDIQKVGGHPNILRLIGVVTIWRDRFCIVTEYCDLGSLGLFLQEKFYKDLFVNELVSEESEEHIESKKQIWKVRIMKKFDMFKRLEEANAFIQRHQSGPDLISRSLLSTK